MSTVLLLVGKTPNAHLMEISSTTSRYASKIAWSRRLVARITMIGSNQPRSYIHERDYVPGASTFSEICILLTRMRGARRTYSRTITSFQARIVARWTGAGRPELYIENSDKRLQ